MCNSQARLFPQEDCCMFEVCLRPVDHLSICCHWCLADKMLEYVHFNFSTSKFIIVHGVLSKRELHIYYICRVPFTVNTPDVMFYELMKQSDVLGILKYTYGSVSAGREKWPFNVLFFFLK